jgi:hypothetical protein
MVLASGCPPPPPTGGPPSGGGTVPAAPSSSSLGVTLFPQETSMWCWAASAQMIVTFLGRPVTQCAQASARFKPLQCPCNLCQSPVATACDQPGWPDFDSLGFHALRTSGAPLSWEQLTQQLCSVPGCRNAPLAFSWQYEGGGGHMMVAKGYSVSPSGGRFVEILNPMAEDEPCVGAEDLIPYDTYRAVPGRHSHWDDFYDITATGP